MRRLTYSLLFVLLFSTIGFSWLIDNLYQQHTSPLHDVDKVRLFEQMGENIGQTLQQLDSRKTFINQWQSSHQYNLNLHQLKELALPESLVKQITSEHFLLLTTDSQLSYHYLLPENNVMVLSAPIDLFEPADSNEKYFYTLLFYTLLLGAFLLWAYPLLKQLHHLQTSAKAFGNGELSRRVNRHRFSYIEEIEQEFNRMAQRIEDLINDVKLLSNAVSHELRTPLARIRFGLDTLAEETDITQRSLYIDKINHNLDQMTELVESLLGYARLEQTMINLAFDPVDIATLLTQISQQFHHQDITINTSLPPNKVFLNGDANFITILINNLITNGLRYGQGKVLIELTEHVENVVIAIHDNGKGVDKALQQNIFKPFVRASYNKVKGYGLGLAIAKRITDWHHGSITIADSGQLGGAKFIVKLPKRSKPE
ncbi:HAMP domain-containing sensor histidine kinase [Thalassotalea ganghwensis]